MRNWFSQRHVAPTDTELSTPAASPKNRTRSSDALHVFVLTSFAVAQPMYDRLGTKSDFLVDQDVSPATAGMLVLLLSFGFPAVIVLFEITLARWKRRFQDICQAIIVFVFLVLLALPVSSRIVFLPSPLMLCLSLAAGGLGVFYYFDNRRVRALVTWAAPGILIFPAVFLAQFSSATATLGPSASRSPEWNPAPVVLLVFDEFCGLTLMNPDREIDADRFPNFAALARQSTWFRNAATVHPYTVQAVPALLSGMHPRSLLTPGPTDRPQNLFNVLTKAGGYELVAFEPVSRLTPRILTANGQQPSAPWRQTLFLVDILGRVFLFHVTPADYHDRLPMIPRAWFGWHDSRVIDPAQRRGHFAYGWNDRRSDQFQHFLNCLDGSPQPTLYFGHFLLPHVPWCYLPSGHQYTEDSANWDLMCLDNDQTTEKESPSDDLAVIQDQQRYLLQLMYVDRLLGQLMSRLSETGDLDRCLLIVTADHGVTFRANQPRRELAPGNQDDILSIPLFIKRPQQTQGEISDRFVQSVDILPTIADVLGLSLQLPTDGWSVFDTSHSARTQLKVTSQNKSTNVDPAILENSQTPAVLRERFGNGSDLEAMFRIGPRPELVGRTVQSLNQTHDSCVEINLLRYGDVVGDSPDSLRPCHYEGTVLTPSLVQEPMILAVAINGTIRAVTRTHKQPSGLWDRWSVLVPESSFHPGQNEVQFFVVTVSDGRLTPCVAVTTKS